LQAFLAGISVAEEHRSKHTFAFYGDTLYGDAVNLTFTNSHHDRANCVARWYTMRSHSLFNISSFNSKGLRDISCSGHKKSSNCHQRNVWHDKISAFPSQSASVLSHTSNPSKWPPTFFTANISESRTCKQSLKNLVSVVLHPCQVHVQKPQL